MGQFGAAFYYCSTAVSFLILGRLTDCASCVAVLAQQSRADREGDGWMAGWRLRKCTRGVRQLRWQALQGGQQ